MDEALDIEYLSGDDLPALNRMCQAIEPLKEADMEKLNAVVLFAEAGDMMTAQMPIRFTHIALGGDAGPYWASGFVSGSVTDAETVKQSAVYQGALRDHPEITNWATLCVAYVGRGLPSALGTVDASDFDLEIMNRTGDRFLDERGVRWLSGPYQMTIAAAPAESLDGSALFQMGHIM